MRRSLTWIAAVLGWCALAEAQAPSAPPAPDIKTEEGLRIVLDDLEARYEAAGRKMAEGVWKEALGETGSPSPSALRTEARGELTALFADPKLGELLGYWTRRRTVTTDPTLTRRVEMWESARDASVPILNPGIASLEEDLSRRIEGHRYALDARIVTRAELLRVLAEDPDGAMRRKAWEALSGAAAAIAPDMKRLVRMRAIEAHLGKYRYYHDAIYRAEDLDPYWVYHMIQILTARTNGAWTRLRTSLMQAAGLKDLAPWDLDYAMTVRARQEGLDRIAAAHLEPAGADRAARRLVKALGFDPGRVPLRLEAGAAGTIPIFVPAVVPGDLRARVPAGVGPHGAAGYHEQVLRAWGRALHAAHNARTAPMLKGYPWIPGGLNRAYAEGMAGAIGDFIRDPIFLTRILGMSADDAAKFEQIDRDRRLLAYRRVLLAAAIEFTVYANPDEDLDGRYRELSRKAFGFDLAGPSAAVWTADPMFLRRPVEYQDLMVGASISADLHEKVRALFGDGRLESGKVGPWLVERCYARGETGTLQERLYESIEGGFGFDAMLKSIGADPVGGPK